MTSKYIPPHLRNRKDTTKKVEPVVMKDSDFPTMVTTNTKMNEFRGPTFREKMTEAPVNAPVRELVEPTPIFTYKYTSKFRKEPAPQEEEEYEAPPPVTDETTDGWTTVEKKVRVKRDRVQEALDNGDAPFDDEDEETSWNDQPEEHETYWDERRH
jgi:hypothetical protein